jgi:hypothetical protein
MEIFDPFGDMMPHLVPRLSRSEVCIGGTGQRGRFPRYQSRVFMRFRSFEKVMRVLVFISFTSLGAPKGMKVPFPW